MIIKLILLAHLLMILGAMCIGTTFLFKRDLELLRKVVAYLVMMIGCCESMLLLLLVYLDVK